MKFTPAGGRVTINILCELQNQENRNKIISKVSHSIAPEVFKKSI